MMLELRETDTERERELREVKMRFRLGGKKRTNEDAHRETVMVGGEEEGIRGGCTRWWGAFGVGIHYILATNRGG